MGEAEACVLNFKASYKLHIYFHMDTRQALEFFCNMRWALSIEVTSVTPLLLPLAQSPLPLV